MAISNKHGLMVVATGNKSEMAAGYSTSTATWSVAMRSSRTCSKPWSTTWPGWRNKNGT